LRVALRVHISPSFKGDAYHVVVEASSISYISFN